MLASTDAVKQLVPTSRSVDKQKPVIKTTVMLSFTSPQATIKTIHDALAAGMRADYVLMDTCFTNEPFLKEIIAEDIDVICMLKDNKQRYLYKGKQYNLKQLLQILCNGIKNHAITITKEVKTQLICVSSLIYSGLVP